MAPNITREPIFASCKFPFVAELLPPRSLFRQLLFLLAVKTEMITHVFPTTRLSQLNVPGHQTIM